MAKPEIPVLESIISEADNSPTRHLMALAQQAAAPLFILRHRGQERLVAVGVDVVGELSDDTRFGKDVFPVLEEMRHIAGDGLFTAYNEEPAWQEAHNILLPAFGPAQMRQYHTTMLAMADRLTAKWDALCAAEESADVLADMTRFAMDTIGQCGFGFEFGSFERTELHPLIITLLRAMVQARMRDNREAGTDHLHRAEDEQFTQDTAFLRAKVDEIIQARISAGDTSTEDLLGLMLNPSNQGDRSALSPQNIRNQVITFLIAGHETTASLLTFALHNLVKNPDTWRKAVAEVDGLWGDASDPRPVFEDVGRLRYVRQVLNESLRLWPIAPMFSRAPHEDTLLGGFYPVKKGQPVRVLIPMLHRDPVWGENTDVFDPERFSPEQDESRPVHAYKPFGTGARACLGRQFSLHEATLALGLLLHRYDFSGYDDYQLNVRQILTFKPDGFTLKPRRRTSASRTAARASLTAHTDGRTAQPVERTHSGSAPEKADRVTVGTKLTVLYGSNLGTCRSIAQRVADEGDRFGFTTSVDPLNKAVDGLPEDGTVVIVLASYNGLPTDDAAEFVGRLERTAEDGGLAGVQYAVLGVGDRNWPETYQAVPQSVDRNLTAAGATALLPRGVADASDNLDGSVNAWVDQLWRRLLDRYDGPAAPSDEGTDHAASCEVRVLHGDALSPLAARHEAVPMTVLHNEELVDTSQPFGRSKRHIRFALPDGAGYRTGDHLLVLPENSQADVDRAARVLGLELDALLDIRPRPGTPSPLAVDRPVTVRELLTHFVELSATATRDQVAAVAEHHPCPPERARLAGLVAGADAETRFSAEIAGPRRTFLDVLESHPDSAVPLPVLVDLLTPRRPRYYSVSSSAEAAPDTVDLMVSVLCDQHGAPVGAASGHLARLEPGDTLPARVHPCREAFRAPGEAPLIMVAAGTGLAPFRGYIGDRLHRLRHDAVLPPALCFFGCDHPDVDYLHRTELAEAEKAGAVSMRPAFSRATEGAGFAQDRLLADGAEVWALLEAGAHIRVCGDGSTLAPGVREAFRTLYRRNTSGSEDEARRWVSELMAAGRYVEDVFVA